MVDLPRMFRSLPMVGGRQGETQVRVGVVDGVIGGPEKLASLAALFPHVAVEPLAAWSEPGAPGSEVLVVGVAGAHEAEVEAAIRHLSAARGRERTIIILRDADVTTTRRLMRAGASDVLPAPVSEPALALSLERLLAGPAVAAGGPDGEVVAVLKAGGGVGATSLLVQTAIRLASREPDGVCVADLDLQFGAAGLYLDLPEAITIDDCLRSSPTLRETPFASALARHRSGVRVLAAPREVVALETLSPAQAESLLGGLVRDFRAVLVDMPTAWTAWTNQVLQRADRIVLVTSLSVPHIQLVKRQLRILAGQALDAKPLTLVCNGVSTEQTASVSIKAAERALGREFDVVVPEDRKLMTAAINQGVELSAVRRATKLEKAIEDLAAKVSILAPAPTPARRWR